MLRSLSRHTRLVKSSTRLQHRTPAYLVHTASQQAPTPLPTSRIPKFSRIPRIASQNAHCVLRTFSSSSRVQNSSNPTPVESFPDPDRPDLFYHLFHSPTPISSSTPVYALSFLQQPPKTVQSRTVIGWLPASANVEGEGEDGAGLNDFRENRASLLHVD